MDLYIRASEIKNNYNLIAEFKLQMQRNSY